MPFQPSNTIEVVNTLGAWDAQAGGLIVALIEGKGIEEAWVFANTISSYVIQVEGATLNNKQFKQYTQK